MDLLLTGGTLITQDHDHSILRTDVAVVGNRIADIGDRHALEARFGAPNIVLDATDRIVMPGFVNAHTHLFQTGMRGLGDGLRLAEWHERIMVRSYEAMTADDAYWFTLLGTLENIRSGVTMVANVQAYPNNFEACSLTARAIGESGLRAQLGKSLYGRGADGHLTLLDPDHLVDTEQVFAQLHGSFDGRVSFAVTPPRATRAPADAMIAAHRIAAAHGSGMHTHVAETAAGAASATAQLGTTEIQYLDSLGVVDQHFQAAHCVAISAVDAALLNERGASIVHCPVSNMYLGSGVADLGILAHSGATMALGTDGPASNNNQDMFAVMKAAALLQRVSQRDAGLGPPGEILDMATRGGAAALGIDAGRIAAGMLADLVVIDTSRPHHQPLHRPISSVVHAGHPDDIESVIVDGRLVMSGREIVGIDERGVIQRARECATALITRAGLDAAGAWPWA